MALKDYTSDNIHLDEPTRFLPRVKASDPKYIKHVYCEGSHSHVLWYSSNGAQCSEPNCIKNKPRDEN